MICGPLEMCYKGLVLKVSIKLGYSLTEGTLNGYTCTCTIIGESRPCDITTHIQCTCYLCGHMMDVVTYMYMGYDGVWSSTWDMMGVVTYMGYDGCGHPHGDMMGGANYKGM